MRAIVMATHPSHSLRRILPLCIGALFAVAAPALVAADPGAKKAASAPPPVAVAEVSSQAKAAQLQNVPDLLRKDLEAELSTLDWSKAKTRRRYLISATVVELGSQPAGPRAVQSSCVVSATVRDAERGNVLIVLQGKARVDEASSASAAERALLSAAARSAIAKVPEALAAAE
jgi:hypothetical protein